MNCRDHGSEVAINGDSRKLDLRATILNIAVSEICEEDKTTRVVFASCLVGPELNRDNDYDLAFYGTVHEAGQEKGTFYNLHHLY